MQRMQSTISRSVPSEASEVGAYKDLKGHVFIIGSINKGKDEDTFCTSMEKMVMYICMEFGAKVAQEWTNGNQTVL